MTVDVESGAAD